MTKYEELQAARADAAARANAHRDQMVKFVGVLHGALVARLGCPAERIRYFKPVIGARLTDKDFVTSPLRFLSETDDDETYVLGLAVLLDAKEAFPFTSVFLRLGRTTEGAFSVAFSLAKTSEPILVPASLSPDLSEVCDRLFSLFRQFFDEQFAGVTL